LVFDDGECSCPVGYNCKHVAAIVMAAVDGRAPGGSVPGRLASRPAAAKTRPSAWETPLRALIDAPAPRAAGNPLAIELALHATAGGRTAPVLMARLMRPGARGGWVNGSLAWSGLESWQVQDGNYRPDHLALVRELYAVHRASEGRGSYYYHYGADKKLDLGACDSVQLWSLLDEAARLGLPLVHARPGLGEVPRYQRGELLLDVTRRGGDGAVVAAVISVDGDDSHDLEPLSFLGASGHGIVCAERAGVDEGQDLRSLRLRLVRLATPAAPRLRRMVLDGERLEIPAGELDRFAADLCPALRSVATVVSSDGSFTPPEISAPVLGLRASYGADHHVQVAWEWAYQVGESVRRTPLGTNGGGPGFRDLEAEPRDPRMRGTRRDGPRALRPARRSGTARRPAGAVAQRPRQHAAHDRGAAAARAELRHRCRDRRRAGGLPRRR
jgi:hypothetical protein